VDKSYLVFAKKVKDAIVVLLYHGVFASEHLGLVHRQAVTFDAVFSEVNTGLLEMLR
jgi:hypothetical protein